MKANGIARLGLGCALALSLNTVHARTLGEPWISEFMPGAAAIPDAAGEWFESYEPFYLNGTTLGDDGADRHRIETDLLILPGEYLTFALLAAPGFPSVYISSSFMLGSAGHGVVLRAPLDDVLRLDYGVSSNVPGRSRELLALPLLATGFGLAPREFGFGPGDIGTAGFAGSDVRSPVSLHACARLFITGAPATFMSSRGLTAGSSVEAKFQENRLKHRNQLTNGKARALTARPGLICTAAQNAIPAIRGLAT